MTQPSLIISATAEKLDPHVGLDGMTRLKLSIGDVTLGGGITPHAGWDGAATHQDGTGFNPGADGVSVAGVVDGSGNAVALQAGAAGTPAPTVLTVQGDPAGSAIPVAGAGTAGAPTGGVQTVQGDPAGTPIPVTPTDPSVPVFDSQTGGNADQVATLPGDLGKTTYISGFQVTGLGATAATSVLVTVTGPSTPLNYIVAVPAGVLDPIVPLIVTFATPVPCASVNTAVVVTVPDFGTGNTAVAVAAQGFQL